MPVLEDGLSDSENISDDERSPSPLPSASVVIKKSTQINANPSSLISSHKQQYAKSNPPELESPSTSFYIRPQVSSSTRRTDQQKISSEESSTIATGRLFFLLNNNSKQKTKGNLDKKLRKKGLFCMFIFSFTLW